MAPFAHPLPPVAAMYTIAVVRGAATCQTWNYDSSADELVWSNLLTSEKQHITLTNVLVFTDERRLPDGTFVSNSCAALDIDVKDVPDALSVNGAHLFYSADACKRALAKHEAVAFVTDCMVNDTTAQQAAATEARFVKLLTLGGTMYAHISEDDGAERCERYRFRSAPFAVKLPEVSGTAIYSEVHDMKSVKHVESFRFMPGSSHPRLFLGDEDRSLEFGDGVVTGIAPMFFSMKECRADIEETVATQRWKPA